MHSSDQYGRGQGRRYFTVAQEVLSSVASGDYAVGARLPTDRELASRHGVSRATAREAVLALELIGVVEVRHGDGVYLRSGAVRVGGHDRDALGAPPVELIESRQVVEPAVAELVAARVDDASLAVLEEELAEAGEIVRDPLELPRFMELGLHFHSRLAASCGNSLLADVVTQLVNAEEHPLWTLVNQHAMASLDARRGQLEEHEAVLRAVRDHDAASAALSMKTHLGHLSTIIFGPPAAEDGPGTHPSRPASGR